MRRLAHRLRVLEALAALSVAQVLLMLLPFRAIARLGGRLQAETGPLEPARAPAAAAVGVAVARAVVWLPWRPRCLAQALAGRMMLARRGVTATLCLGVARRDGEMLAHAWLMAGGGVVCGGREVEGFTPIAAFVSAGKPRRP